MHTFSACFRLVLLVGLLGGGAAESSPRDLSPARQAKLQQKIADARQILAANPDARAAQKARIELCHARFDLGDMAPPAGSAAPRSLGEGIVDPKSLFVGGLGDRASEDLEASQSFRFVIDREGCVRDVVLLSKTETTFTRRALRNLPRWVYSPASAGGNPVEVFYEIKFPALGIPASR
jgi:hypothetical protein